MADGFDLVLFDLGGVIGEIDRDALVSAAGAARLDPRPALAFWRSGYDGGFDDDHPIHRAERGEISAAAFIELAEAIAPGASMIFDVESPLYLMRFVRPSPTWAEVARAARAHGVRIGALTNTMEGLCETQVTTVNPVMHQHTRGLFGDDILESHLIGCRKPDAAAFLAATDHFGVDPTRVVFIDDELGNCAGAAALGMMAVHVEQDGAPAAVIRAIGASPTSAP